MIKIYESRPNSAVNESADANGSSGNAALDEGANLVASFKLPGDGDLPATDYLETVFFWQAEERDGVFICRP